MLPPKKLLLAEDDADDRSFFRDFLWERQDVHLLPCVENGVELMEVLDATEDDKSLPDVIILDQNMPKRNGLQTLHLLKLNDRYANIPTMVYSTYIDERLIKDSLRNGASLVFPKPSDKAGYNKMIDEFLKTI
jgi:CheY-like chemotaxis protein